VVCPVSQGFFVHGVYMKYVSLPLPVPKKGHELKIITHFWLETKLWKFKYVGNNWIRSMELQKCGNMLGIVLIVKRIEFAD